ncbi:MAG: type II secretion system protein [Phycisphaerales bacterium JB040]
MHHPAATPRRRAFTLIEVLIVVVILGLLAAVVAVGFGDAVSSTRRSAFVTDLHNFSAAAEYYVADTGQPFEDGASGFLPPGMEHYVEPGDFQRRTPLGGLWDTEGTSSGFTSGLGVHFDDPSENPGLEIMTQIDALIDDGDLTTGAFRQADADRFYYAIVY